MLFENVTKMIQKWFNQKNSLHRPGDNEDRPPPRGGEEVGLPRPRGDADMPQCSIIQ